MSEPVFSYAELAEKAKLGDKAAFLQLRQRLEPSTARLAQWYAPEGHKARVAELIWQTAWERLASLEEPRLFRSWLFNLGRELSEEARK